jgi:hypothetical protein
MRKITSLGFLNLVPFEVLRRWIFLKNILFSSFDGSSLHLSPKVRNFKVILQRIWKRKVRTKKNEKSIKDLQGVASNKKG